MKREKDRNIAKEYKKIKRELLTKAGIDPDKNAELPNGIRFEVHHITPVSQGGGEIDQDNLEILKGYEHAELHTKNRFKISSINRSGRRIKLPKGEERFDF